MHNAFLCGMASNPNENHIRTVTAASLIIKAYRDAHPHSKIEEFIDKDTVMAILNHVEFDRLNY